MLLIALVNVGNLLWHTGHHYLKVQKCVYVCVSWHFSLVILVLAIHEDQKEVTVFGLCTKVPETQEKLL